MTEATSLKSGEYVVNIPNSLGTMTARCLYWNGQCWWLDGEELPEFPPASTIIASIADLLRDAARYRWIIGNGIGRLDDLYDACNWEPAPGQIDALIDAEIARDAEGGDRG